MENRKPLSVAAGDLPLVLRLALIVVQVRQREFLIPDFIENPEEAPYYPYLGYDYPKQPKERSDIIYNI